MSPYYGEPRPGTSEKNPGTNGRSNLSFAKNKPGVYIIYQNDKLAYIGYSGTNVEKTCLRHFQYWKDEKQVRVWFRNYNACKVRIILTKTAAQAAALENRLIHKYAPPKNPKRPKELFSRLADEMERELQNASFYSREELDNLPF